MAKCNKKALETVKFFILQDLWPSFKSGLHRTFTCKPCETYMLSSY